MSPEDDRRCGGGDFFFTRLRKETPGSSDLIFNRRKLLDIDSISYRRDRFGSQRGDPRWNDRDRQLQNAKDNHRSSDNEVVNFKRFSLITDLEYVLVPDFATAKKVVAAFKKAGIEELGGDPVEQRVVLDYQSA